MEVVGADQMSVFFRQRIDQVMHIFLFVGIDQTHCGANGAVDLLPRQGVDFGGGNFGAEIVRFGDLLESFFFSIIPWACQYLHTDTHRSFIIILASPHCLILDERTLYITRMAKSKLEECIAGHFLHN